MSIPVILNTAFGLEAVVAREVQALGYGPTTVSDGKIELAAELSAIPRLNLFLRAADRVRIRIARFMAFDFGELFDQTFETPWEEWIGPRDAFPVTGKSIKSQLHSIPDCQRIVKKAIVERLRKAHGVETLPEEGASFSVEVAVHKDEVTLSLDTSGSGLNKRGYRKGIGPAPLRESLAAGMVLLSYWNRDRPFHDPFCGSGTIAIEAAMIGRNIAPGLNREFAAERWKRIPTDAWKQAREEARSLILPSGFERPFIASDIDRRALGLVRQHADLAGVGKDIHIQQLDATELKTSRKYGCIITNPPYGERMGDDGEDGDSRDIEGLYRKFGQAIDDWDTWSTYVLTTHPGLERLWNRPATRRRKLFNAQLTCTYYQFVGPRPPVIKCESQVEEK